MRIDRLTETAFGMDEATWRRHANPLSVWTRFTALPLLVLTLWSRDWIGWWSVLPVGLALAWIWVNPRLFAEPARTDGWASRAVMGERIWLDRDRIALPPPILKSVRRTMAPMMLGMAILILGVAMLEPWTTVLGAVLIYAGKIRFLVLMVRLWDEAGGSAARDDRA